MTDKFDPAALKPCPFCGGNAEYVSENGSQYIWCPECGLRTGKSASNAIESEAYNKKMLHEYWNTSAEVSQPVTDAERQQALPSEKWPEWKKQTISALINNHKDLQDQTIQWFQSASIFSDAWETFPEFMDYIHLALTAPAPQPVDVEALKKTIPYPNSFATSDNRKNGEAIGWNAAIDHIASEYDLIKKVK